MRVIAIEEHAYTPKYIEYLFSRKEFPRREFIQKDGKKYVREWWSPTNFRLSDPDKPQKISDIGEGRIRDMDAAGIDMQVISLSFPGVERFEAEGGTHISKIVNDELSEIVRQYPKRFAAYATLAPQDPPAAAAELERAVTQLGLKGAMITGHIRGEYLDEKKYWVILEMAEKLDVPLYIHPAIPSPELLKAYLPYPALASGILGFAADTSLHAMRLILSGVFEKYPRLKIILGHLGEALPFWLWRMDSRIEEEIQTDPLSNEFYEYLTKSPSSYFKNNFYVTTSGMYWEPALQFVNSVLGSDRIMFAADYPYESSQEAVKFLKEAKMKTADREKIFHSNAEKLLRL